MSTTLGQMLSEGRKAAGMSQRWAARLLGIDFTYLSKIERDIPNYAPSELVLKRAAIIYELDSDALFVLARRCPPDLAFVLSHDLEKVKCLRKLWRMDYPADFSKVKGVEGVRLST